MTTAAAGRLCVWRAEDRRQRSLLLFSIGVLMGVGALLAGCAASDPPDRTIRLDGALYDWHAGGECFYALGNGHTVAHLWRWEGETLVKVKEIPLGEFSGERFAVVRGTTFFRLSYSWRPYEVRCLMGDVESGKVSPQWKVVCGDQEVYTLSSPSSNGAHIAVYATEFQFRKNDRLRLGCLDSKTGDVSWVVEDEDLGGAIRYVRPSDDGRYIGIAGWGWGVTMVDVVERKVLWKQRPGEELTSHSLAFTADSKLVYSGGVEGAVYGMDVLTGRVVTKWWPTFWGSHGGRSHVDDLSVSPDGRFVAACTSPTGRVVLFDRSSGDVLRVLSPGGDTIGFSRDSKYLAAACPFAIRIWRIQ